MNATHGPPPARACPDPAPWLLVPDGRIPTTAIIEPVLRAAVEPQSLSVALLDELSIESLAAHHLVFSRVCAPEFAWLPGWLVRNRARYAFFLDDNLWEYRSGSEVGVYYARPEVRQVLDRFLHHASCVLVNTKPLADAVRARHPAVSIAIVPAPFEFMERATRPETSGLPLRVGYAGTERGAAFEPVIAAMQAATAARPGEFAFEFIGHIPDALADLPDVTCFPDMSDYRSFLAFKASRRWDVGLAPLDDNEFTRAKTNNKYREYGGLGIAGIYSDVQPYRGCVTDGVDGLLVPNASAAWLNALLQMAQNRKATAAMGQQARANVWQRHRIDVVWPQWRLALADAGIQPARAARIAIYESRLRRAHARMTVRASAYLAILRSAGARELFLHLARRLHELLRR